MKTSTLTNKLKSVLVAVAFILLNIAGASAQVKNVVLVHGAFADGSGWKNVYKILVAKGYHVTVVQNPLSSLEADVAATNAALDQLDGPAILVGHSWGGVVITQAGLNPKVAGLVYVAAFMPDQGETAVKWISSAPAAPEAGILAPDANGIVYYDRAKYHAGFCADISKEDADFMAASQGTLYGSAFGTPVTNVAWKEKPAYAIVSTEDKAIVPSIQREMYKRANAKVTEIKGSHVVFISQPQAVAKVIISAAENVK
ncbi:alpha/beta hydrolase [Chitinophaga agrisoli]|uniref:Alpha/beta hydrolase n=1 Tax=Chitinophaga agrisoli TaxID=2607653 RepID=A0A5B2W577_9BACT|nr:alpha/beta hydrolase [Chitinophaga agrisoli]KAA2245379.1 alpha/beta hydrolase [Chitinophaga agrisoli]